MDFKVTEKERSRLAPSAPEELLACQLNAGHQSSSSWEGWPGWRGRVSPDGECLLESRKQGFVTLPCHGGVPERESPPCVLVSVTTHRFMVLSSSSVEVTYDKALFQPLYRVFQIFSKCLNVPGSVLVQKGKR